MLTVARVGVRGLGFIPDQVVASPALEHREAGCFIAVDGLLVIVCGGRRRCYGRCLVLGVTVRVRPLVDAGVGAHGTPAHSANEGAVCHYVAAQLSTQT